MALEAFINRQSGRKWVEQEVGKDMHQGPRVGSQTPGDCVKDLQPLAGAAFTSCTTPCAMFFIVILCLVLLSKER